MNITNIFSDIVHYANTTISSSNLGFEDLKYYHVAAVAITSLAIILTAKYRLNHIYSSNKNEKMDWTILHEQSKVSRKHIDTLIVWEKLAGEIKKADNPDLSELKAFDDFKSKSAGFSKWIEENLISLKCLEKLDLARSRLTSLPPEFCNLTNLKVLDLGGNELTSLPPEFCNLTNLELLKLQQNKLIELPPEIRKLAEL